MRELLTVLMPYVLISMAVTGILGFVLVHFIGRGKP